MKKLFFAILFTLGFIAIIQAQTLTWNIQNQSSYDWDWKMVDGNGNSVYYPLLAGPSAPVTGSFVGFGWPLQMGGTNSLGCSAYTSTGPTPGASIPFVCGVPNVINYSLTVVPIWPFINYHLHLEIS